MSEDAPLLVRDTGAVRTLTLNRPARRNALTPAMQGMLIEALEAAAADPACRVVVLDGAGEAFCAGLDLTSLQGMNDRTELEHRADAERIARMFHTLYALPKPTIAAVHGTALAGGTGLATLCDFTLTAPGVKFGYTEVRIGFVPALVAAYLVLQVGEKRARALLLTGRVFTAEEALGMGLVTAVVPAVEMAEAVAGLAGTLIANSPESMRATKALLVAQSKDWLNKALAESLEANARARGTRDFREGVAAFLEKRKAVWGEG